jgi:hypothetical protein
VFLTVTPQTVIYLLLVKSNKMTVRATPGLLSSLRSRM